MKSFSNHIAVKAVMAFVFILSLSAGVLASSDDLYSCTKEEFSMRMEGNPFASAHEAIWDLQQKLDESTSIIYLVTTKKKFADKERKEEKLRRNIEKKKNHLHKTVEARIQKDNNQIEKLTKQLVNAKTSDAQKARLRKEIDIIKEELKMIPYWEKGEPPPKDKN